MLVRIQIIDDSEKKIKGKLDATQVKTPPKGEVSLIA
jgi:hypothetical protein